VSALSLPPLSLYIHIPWCERKCPYCDFNSHRAEGALPAAAYIEALLRDLEQDLEFVQGREILSIFIGGGTPSLLSGEALHTLLSGIRQRVSLARDAEVTLEANPGSAEAEKFAAFVAAGVNRISLGIQSFDDSLLQALGRVHDSAQAHRAIEIASKVGLRSLNIDLMHGLPGQDGAGAGEDLRQAMAYRPAHLSWYQLTIEPNTEYYKRPPVLPVEEALGDIQDAGESLLAGGGYQAYEVSAYAQPGFRCEHNLNYWRFGDYLGIGAGAHGKLTSMRDNTVWRFAKRRQPQHYLEAGAGQYRSEVRQLDAEDLRGEYMLNALRLHDGLNLGEFTARTGLAGDSISAQLESLMHRGLLEESATGVRATALGRRYLDSVVAEFFD